MGLGSDQIGPSYFCYMAGGFITKRGAGKFRIRFGKNACGHNKGNPVGSRDGILGEKEVSQDPKRFGGDAGGMVPCDTVHRYKDHEYQAVLSVESEKMNAIWKSRRRELTHQNLECLP